MNGNRSKYTYTPTYGMQKRGVLKKNASVHQAPEAPDFTQVPDPVIGTPLQQTIPVQSMQNPSSFSGFTQMNSPYGVANQAIPMQQGFPTENTQASFMMPNFVQPVQAAQLPPIQSVLQQNQISTNLSKNAEKGSFSARSQGFVPPVQNNAPVVPPQPSMVMQNGWIQPQQPVQQSIPPFPGARMNPPYPESGFQTAQVQQPQAFPQFQPVSQQPSFILKSNKPAAAPRSASTDFDKLLSVFLFGILPLLFIPCIFTTSAWDAIRYVFIGAAVAGLGAMWYRQLYTPLIRLISSIVYVALCVVTIAMLMQGNDAKLASTNLSSHQPAQVAPSETPSPDANAVVPVPSESPVPTVAGPSEAERRLSLFMELWKVNNTTEMVNLVQPSWRSQQENASTSLFFTLANRTPEDFTIEGISGTETDNSRTVTMRATINKNTGKAPVVYRFMVMMVKEGGDWYVNPNSLATNDAEEKTQTDENVVKTQGSGVVTEPPRETVTPAPPASTLLYYNIGGNNYHMDPECPRVGRDYLPFDASFPYSDLRSYNRELLPCLHCNAPVDPLD